MKQILTAMLLVVAATFAAAAQVTIEECVDKARDHYPLIRKYQLLDATTAIDLSDINKSWLPQIGVYGQLTGQNVVPSFPKALTGMMQQLGQEMRGLSKLQYKAGVELSQTIWDGGASALRRDMARSRDEVDRATLDIELYAVRERVENIFFAIMLTEEQIAQSSLTLELLRSNRDKMQTMLDNGTAMQSDVDMLEAQVLTMAQSITLAESAARAYREVLGIFTGEDMLTQPLAKPAADEPANEPSARPELKLFASQQALNSLTDRQAVVATMPKVGLFANAYYGYPGFNYFQSMINRELSFNILAGVKVSWNIDSFYTRRNSSRRTALNADNIAADRDKFLFNTDMQQASQRETIRGIRSTIADDARIIELRANVRRAAEVQMENGVIDTTALLAKISDENMARLVARLHQIQLLQEIYKLKYTLNR